MQLGHADILLQKDVHTKMLCYNMPLLANRVIEKIKSVQLEQWKVLTDTTHISGASQQPSSSLAAKTKSPFVVGAQ